jgi:hypothetical protein
LIDPFGPDTVTARMRVLVLIAVLHGLVPGLGEVVESAVHLASTGHLAHSAGETDLGDQGPEHSCGVTLHSCGCCAGQPVMSELELATLSQGAATERPLERGPDAVVDRAPARPFRPPIA